MQGARNAIAAAVLLACLAGGVRSDDSSIFGKYFQQSQCTSPYSLAAESHSLQTLAAAIKAAGLVSDLDTTSSAITVFAPTDDAFAALAAALNLSPEELLSKSDLLSVILEYHVYDKAAYKAADFKKHTTLVTAEGESLKVKTVGDIVTVMPAAGSPATILVSDLSACKAYVHIIDTVLIPTAAAAKLGLPSVDVSGAAETETEAVQGVVDKKTGAATPAATVPVETVIVTPATPLPKVQAATTPAVAVSGARAVPSPEAVPVVIPVTPAATPEPTSKGLLAGLLGKKTPLNTFAPAPTPKATPEATPAASKKGLKDLLLKETPAASAVPVKAVVVPAATTVPAVKVSVPTPTPVVVPVPVAKVTETPQPKLINELLAKKPLNTFTPVATVEATPKPSTIPLKQLLLKETPAATQVVSVPVKKTPIVDLLDKQTPAATPAKTVLVPVTPVVPEATPAATAPAVPVSGARVVASPEVSPALVATPVTDAVAPAIEAVGDAVTSARQQRQAAVAPAVARVSTAVDGARNRREEAVAPARAAVAEAADTLAGNRRAVVTPITAAPAVMASDGPMVAPVAASMAPAPQGVAPESAPGAAMAPAVQAEQGPAAMSSGSAPAMAPQTAPMAAMAPGVVGFAALDALKTSNQHNSPCTTVLQAAMMVPQLSTFVTTAQAANLSDYLNDSLVATVFVPTNDAFTKALSQYGITTQQAATQPALLKGLLQYHVVPGMATSTGSLTNGQTLNTALSGQTLKVTKTGSIVTIQPTTGTAANILEADVPVCKADMDVVDTLLFPSITALPASTRALVAGQSATSTSGR